MVSMRRASAGPIAQHVSAPALTCVRGMRGQFAAAHAQIGPNHQDQLHRHEETVRL